MSALDSISLEAFTFVGNAEMRCFPLADDEVHPWVVDYFLDQVRSLHEVVVQIDQIYSGGMPPKVFRAVRNHSGIVRSVL